MIAAALSMAAAYGAEAAEDGTAFRVRPMELGSYVMPSGGIGETANRNRLLDTLARRHGGNTSRCDLWNSWGANRKGVFLTITDLVAWSWMQPNPVSYFGGDPSCNTLDQMNPADGNCDEGCWAREYMIPDDYTRGNEGNCEWVDGWTCYWWNNCAAVPRARRFGTPETETILDHITALLAMAPEAGPGEDGGLDKNRLWYAADDTLLYAFRNLYFAPFGWGPSGDFFGHPHSPFNQSRETFAGQPRGQSQEFAWDYNAQPLVRVGTVLPADPHMMEMDMDYNFWHDSNPEAYYSGEYGRDKYTRVWRQQGFACDLQFTPSCTDDGSFFVKQVYRDVLNREADPGGLAFYQGQIDQCNYDSACVDARQAAIAEAFISSDEVKLANPTIWAGAGALGTHSYNQALIGQLYQSFLRREPDSGGGAFWTDNLDSTGNYTGVSGAFVESTEYKARFPSSGPR